MSLTTTTLESPARCENTMPTDTDILLEDGTVWDGSDFEEPFMTRRLQLCDSCRSMMASPERVQALRAGFTMCGRPSTAGGAGARAPCAMRAMLLSCVEEWNNKAEDSIDHYDNVTSKRRVIEDPSKARFSIFALMHGRGDEYVENLLIFGLNGDLAFTMYALPSDPAAEYVKKRPAMADLFKESGAQIRSWMDTCSREHSECPKPIDAILPTRVLDVEPGPGRHDNIRVHETCGEIGRYVALSYCWGGLQPVLLETHVYEQMTSPAGIELRQLPQTIRDAVRVTRELGLRYLWVDALCIIQDSREDMKHELAQMASVFKQAYITISAASARTCRDGFLQYRMPKRSRFPRFELPYRTWEDGPAGTVTVHETSKYCAFEEPVNTRAWCFQESLLSPRLATFGVHELIWQCGRNAFDFHYTLTTGGLMEAFSQSVERLDPAFFDPERTIERLQWGYSWDDVVINYSRREMSYEEDKLMALAALATEHQRLSDGDEYVAGLWRRDLNMWLEWFVDPSPSADYINGYQTLQPRPSVYVAPSWSWASVRGIISIGDGKDFRAEVLRCEVTLQEESLPTGAVTGGVLELRVQLKEARWSGKHLFEIAGAESRPIADAFMDADEEKPELVSCLWMWRASGLIVVRKSPTTYMRVGQFQLRGPILATPEVWFERCEFQNITLV